MYMADGWLPSNDGESIYLYIAGLPCTHGEILAEPLWGNNTGVRMLKLRKDGFTSVVAPYVFNVAAPSELPSLTTRELTVPSGCRPGPPALVTSCAYEYPNSQCPASAPPATCASDNDCRKAVPGFPNITCHGKVVECINHECASHTPGGQLCMRHAPTGGPVVGLNIETSVAGYALVEVQHNGVAVAGMTLNESVPIRGSALYAEPSWSSGATLSALAGLNVSLRIALTDARLFAVRSQRTLFAIHI